MKRMVEYTAYHLLKESAKVWLTDNARRVKPSKYGRPQPEYTRGGLLTPGQFEDAVRDVVASLDHKIDTGKLQDVINVIVVAAIGRKESSEEY